MIRLALVVFGLLLVGCVDTTPDRLARNSATIATAAEVATFPDGSKLHRAVIQSGNGDETVYFIRKPDGTTKDSTMTIRLPHGKTHRVIVVDGVEYAPIQYPDAEPKDGTNGP